MSCSSAHSAAAQLRGGDDQFASSEASDLIQIGLEFSSIQLKLGKLRQIQEKIWPGAAWNEETERKWSKKVEPLWDRKAELRRIARVSEAGSLAELRTKAVMLMDLVQDDPEDECAQLAISLCLDLVTLADNTEINAA